MKGTPTHQQFESRRRKEQQAFLVVKFLRAWVLFRSIAQESRGSLREGSLAGSGLFDKVRDLADSVVYDLKEKAHSLFRNGAHLENEHAAELAATARPPRVTRQRLASMKNNIETLSIDSYIGTIYHLLQILQESLYQIERYTPELEKEKKGIGRMLELSRAAGAAFSSEERAELERLKALDEISDRIAADSEELAMRVMERCEALFAGTAEVIRHFVVSACDNEILVLNLLENRGLMESVYGEGSSERIFSELCKGKAFSGATGLERALNYARSKCGNVSALPPA
jgi:hypothetical protein